MKNLKQLSAFVLPLLLLTAFCTDSKLTQEGAEKAITEFIKFSNTSALGPKLHILEVLNTEPVNQSSENQASCWVTAKGKVENSGSDSIPIAGTHIETNFKMEFIFKKKAGYKWVLTEVCRFASTSRVSEEYMDKFHKQSLGLNIPAQ